MYKTVNSLRLFHATRHMGLLLLCLCVGGISIAQVASPPPLTDALSPASAMSTPGSIPATPVALPSAPGAEYPAAAGQSATPVAGLPASSLPVNERERLERRRAMEEVLPRVREAFARGDYQGVLTAVEEAERVDPGNANLQFYREMAKKKIIAGETPVTGYAIGTPAIGLPTPPPGTNLNAPPPTPVIAGSQNSDPGAVTPSTDGSGDTQASAANSSQPARGPGKEGMFEDLSPTTLFIIGFTGLLVVAGTVVFVVKKRRSVAAAASNEEDEEDDDATGGSSVQPVMGIAGGMMGMPPPIPRPDDDAPITPADVLKGLENPSVVSTPAPSFDLFDSPTMELPAGYHDNMPTLHDNMPTLIEEHPEHEVQEPAPPAFEYFSEEASPKPEPAPAPLPPPAEKAEEPRSFAGGSVSFDDLGIFMSEPAAEPKPASSIAPPPATAAPAEIPDNKPVAPSPQEQHKAPGQFDSIVLSDFGFPSAGTEAPPPTAPQQPKADTPISLQDVKLAAPALPASKPADPDAEATLGGATPPKQEGTIDLEDLLFGDLEGTIGASAKASPLNSVTLDATLDSTKSLPPDTPKAPASLPASDETLHSQDTLMIPAASPQAPIEIQPYQHPNEELAATVGLPGSESGKSSSQKEAAAQSPEAGSPDAPTGAFDDTVAVSAVKPSSASVGEVSEPSSSQLDERSEKMFREQYERAERAMADKNWKQAVHYLSIAAAIHPENTEIREKLREAREHKRRAEVSA